MKTIRYLNPFIILLVLVFSFGCTQSVTRKKDICSEEQNALEAKLKEQLKLLSEAFSRNDYHEIYRVLDKYLTENSIITINFFQKDGNRTQHSITPLKYKSILVQRLTAVIDYKTQFTDIKVEMARIVNPVKQFTINLATLPWTKKLHENSPLIFLLIVKRLTMNQW